MKRKKGDVFLFVDGVDDLEMFSHYPFDARAQSLLRAFVQGTFSWSRSEDRPIRLVALLRPEFLDLAQLPNIKPKIEDNALRLEWNEQSLFEMLSHRINIEVEVAMAAAADRAAYFRRIGTRELFGRTETEHTRIVHRLLNYGFLRPRDLIRYTKFTADHALSAFGADPHQPLPLDYFDKVIDKQRQYLLDEMKAELAVTLPDYERFIQALSQLHAAADEKVFITREEVENNLNAMIEKHSLDIDARSALARLYSAFAVGYRGAGNSRLFIYSGGSTRLPDGNQITLHDLFRDAPSDRPIHYL